MGDFGDWRASLPLLRCVICRLFGGNQTLKSCWFNHKTDMGQLFRNHVSARLPLGCSLLYFCFNSFTLFYINCKISLHSLCDRRLCWLKAFETTLFHNILSDICHLCLGYYFRENSFHMLWCYIGEKCFAFKNARWVVALSAVLKS